ncbi:MAG: ThuA domain-containing protein, partial [Lentisphaeria bacterium]|nr:ThuA domain-containing protein [Lentisphaeria bacterium]
GVYLVAFQYTKGWNGASSQRVALASSPAGEDAPLTELAVDEHAGSTGVRNQDNVYRLDLEQLEPGRRYWLRVKYRGTRPQDQVDGKRGCEGKITLMQEAPPDVALRIMGTRPQSAEECPVPGQTPFKGRGVRVGVLVGGYGSEGILATLAKVEDMDAVPIAAGRLLADQCQVIVLPQMRSNPPPAATMAALEEFVRQGGGVIATHDAVGYRAMPKWLPSICAGGQSHVREEAWRIKDTTHPLAQGLPAGQALAQTYTDHIQLSPGPDAAVVVVSEKTQQPVVLAGAVGKGRYVACGLLIGTDVKAEEAPAAGPEATLLVNAIRWCAAGGR